MAHLRVLEALGRKYDVVFVTRDSISVESSAAEARRAEVASTRSAQPRNTVQSLAQGGAKKRNRANARYDGGRVFEVALDAQEGLHLFRHARDGALSEEPGRGYVRRTGRFRARLGGWCRHRL